MAEFPGSWLEPGAVLRFRIPAGEGLSDAVLREENPITVNGIAWRGVVEGVTRDERGLTLHVALRHPAA